MRCQRQFVEFTTYAPGNPPQRKLDRGEGNVAGQGFGKVFEILGETLVSSEAGEGALDDPAAR